MIYHITSLSAWKIALRDGDYHPDSLSTEGFIHCSTVQQITRTANTLYYNQQGLLMLCIEPRRVRAEIRYENTNGGEELFPHIYGALNLDAVAQVIALKPDKDGTFSIPLPPEADAPDN